ncbi:MAG: hypothetical protein AB7F59_03910 [Bdellovibrionales bacterium]
MTVSFLKYLLSVCILVVSISSNVFATDEVPQSIKELAMKIERNQPFEMPKTETELRQLRRVLSSKATQHMKYAVEMVSRMNYRTELAIVEVLKLHVGRITRTLSKMSKAAAQAAARTTMAADSVVPYFTRDLYERRLTPKTLSMLVAVEEKCDLAMYDSLLFGIEKINANEISDIFCKTAVQNYLIYKSGIAENHILNEQPLSSPVPVVAEKTEVNR